MHANATRPPIGRTRPQVSVIMANHQGAAWLERALRSLMVQSLTEIEIIVIDDASTDASVAIVERLAAGDPRLRLLRLDRRGGPARARNTGLEMARGRWIAVVDGDDIVHPERFERLLAAAAHTGADVVADDLMVFHTDGAPARLLLGGGYREPFYVSAGDLIGSGARNSPPLGYLKPVIRAELLDGLRYDESLRIGEDHDLLLRVLLRNAAFWVVPVPWYLYHRHGASLSHRLSVADLAAMIAGERRLLAEARTAHPEIVGALRRRLARLQRGLAFEELAAAARQRRMGPVLGALARDPALMAPLARAMGEHLRKPRQSAAPAGVTPRTVVLTERAAAPMAGDAVLRVPAYRAPDAREGAGEWTGALWRRLGDLAAGGPLRVVCDGPAAIYAAGFIPAGRIAIVSPEAVLSPAPATMQAAPLAGPVGQ